ncbi:MAG: endonuclease III [Coriobacteriia bacterium]|nr:endonuclease III [Coriobacteriia bacterium]
MPREKKADKQARIVEICRRMDEHYPRERCHLNYETPFQLTIAVLLSAQTTDAGVNRVTPELFAKYGTPERMASANVENVMEIIRSIGFYRTKAANCIKCAQMVLTEFGGEIPQDMNLIQKLPGVGRKTANVVLNEAFGIVEGIAVDTHVFRISHKLKLVGPSADTPAKTEEALLRVIPRELWGPVNHQWVAFGREVCIARRPQCDSCFISDLCPSFKAGSTR